MPLQESDFQITVSAEGELAELRSVAITVPQVRSGSLTLAWLLPEGSLVKAGDPVAHFDGTEARLNLEKQQNTLDTITCNQAIAERQQLTDDRILGFNIDAANKDYQYSMKVLPQDETIFSKWEMIDARINADLAKGQVDLLRRERIAQARSARSERQALLIDRNRTQTEISLARQTLDSLQLTAPGDGLLLYQRDRGREPQIGDQCYRGQVLAEVADVSAPQARLFVLERDAGNLAPGKKAIIEFDALTGRRFEGELTSVAALPQPLERNSPLRYFTCVAAISGIGKDLQSIRPGMALNAEIILDRYDSCFVVPGSAVTNKGTANVVYIQQDDDFVAEPVDAIQTPYGQAVILSGVNEGDVIALQNPFEKRQLHLPDFSKGSAAADRPHGPRRPGRMR